MYVKLVLFEVKSAAVSE